MTRISPKYSNEYQFTSLPGSQDGCFDPGCYTDNITYYADSNQIAELVLLSQNCEQEVVNNCSVSQLTNFAWWTGRDGEIYKYWHGDQSKNKNGGFITLIQYFNIFQGCQCYFDGTCDNLYNQNNFCNCDERADENSDIGILQNKDQLPIMQLAYGDAVSRYSFIHYSVGDFICYGKDKYYPNELNSDFHFKASYTGGT